MSTELTKSQLETLQTITKMIEADFGQKEALKVLLVLSPKAQSICRQKQIEKHLSFSKEVFDNVRHIQRQPVLQMLETFQKSFPLSYQV